MNCWELLTEDLESVGKLIFQTSMSVRTVIMCNNYMCLVSNRDNEIGLTQPIYIHRTCSDDTHNVEHSTHTLPPCQKGLRP